MRTVTVVFVTVIEETFSFWTKPKIRRIFSILIIKYSLIVE